MTFITTGKATGLYHSSIVVEALSSGNVVSATLVTFLVRIVQGSNNQPPVYDTPPTPAYTVAPGDNLAISLQASDPDAGDTVEIVPGPLPTGATFNPTDGNPAIGAFSFTPTAAQDGQDFVVNFTAQDGNGGAVLRSFTIKVRTPVVTVPQGKMNGKGSLTTSGVKTIYAFILDCAADTANFSGKIGSQVFKSLAGSAGNTIVCSDDPGVPTPSVGFDTASGTVVGTYAGQPATIEFKMVDGGADTNDTAQLTVRNGGGTVVFTGTGAPPGQYPGARQPTGSTSLTRDRRSQRVTPEGEGFGPPPRRSQELPHRHRLIVAMSRLLVISPVRDEAEHIERLVRSVATQTRPPDLWIVADDGSRDATAARLEAASAQLAFLRVLSVPAGSGDDDNETRLAGAAEIKAFNWALTCCAVDAYTHVAKLDGDIELPADYFARVLAEFERDPSLGVAGGPFSEPGRGGWRTVREPSTHVPGALKVYSRECLEAVGGLREHLGWDTIDETTARMLGFTTRSLPGLVARHHRPMGSVTGRLRGRGRYGTCAYASGYGAGWVLLRSLKVAMLPPRGLSGVAFLTGYARAGWRRVPRADDPEYRRFVRAELRGRLRGTLRIPGAPEAAQVGTGSERCVLGGHESAHIADITGP